MSPSTVCFSARDDNYGAFYIPTNGSIITFKLIYKYGHVNCLALGLGLWLSRWGCNWLGRTHPMGALLTDSSRNRLLPKDRYLFGGSDCGTSQLYMLPWAGPNRQPNLMNSASIIFLLQCQCQQTRNIKYGLQRTWRAVMSWITVLKKHVLRCTDCTFDSIGSWIFIKPY